MRHLPVIAGTQLYFAFLFAANPKFFSCTTTSHLHKHWQDINLVYCLLAMCLLNVLLYMQVCMRSDKVWQQAVMTEIFYV